MIKSQKVFSSSSIYGSVIDLPSSLPPPSSTCMPHFSPHPSVCFRPLARVPRLTSIWWVHCCFTLAPSHSHCCLDAAKLAVAKAEYSAMEKAGIISCSTSQWAFAFHMVKKKHEGCVVITASSIPPWLLIITTFQTSPTSLHISVVLLSFSAGFTEGVLQGASQAGGHWEDGLHHPFQNVGILGDAVQSQEC